MGCAHSDSVVVLPKSDHNIRLMKNGKSTTNVLSLNTRDNSTTDEDDDYDYEEDGMCPFHWMVTQPPPPSIGGGVYQMINFSSVSDTQTTTRESQADSVVCVTVKSYDEDDGDDVVDEVCPTSTVRDATDAVKKAMEVTPLENIILAGIPMCSMMPSTLLQHHYLKHARVRSWLGSCEVEVTFDDPTATSDAWGVWKAIQGKQGEEGDRNNNKNTFGQEGCDGLFNTTRNTGVCEGGDEDNNDTTSDVIEQ
eukprot:PhF_6_TR21696/c0_g1_i1/m.30981